MSRVYFIRCDRDGPFKVGFTNGEPQKRLYELQPGSPWPLYLIGSAAGSKPNERALHDLFAPHRMQREWFSPVDAVSDTIKKILAGSFDWSQASPLDRAIVRAGSQTALSHQIGFGQPAISIARKFGMSDAMRAAVSSYLELRT